MIKFLKEEETQNNTENSVSVVDNHLVLSLTKTKNPVIWRMSLDDIGSAVFSIKNQKNVSKLILKRKDGEEEIASFDNTDEANEMLFEISSNLTNPQKAKRAKKNKTSTTETEANDNTEATKWGIALVLALLIVGLYMYLTTLMPTDMLDIEQTSASTSTAPQSTTGQPLDADEFLKGL